MDISGAAEPDRPIWVRSSGSRNGDRLRIGAVVIVQCRERVHPAGRNQTFPFFFLPVTDLAPQKRNFMGIAKRASRNRRSWPARDYLAIV